MEARLGSLFFLSPRAMVAAKSLKKSETPSPVLAETSAYFIPRSFIFASKVALSIALLSLRSLLLPNTRIRAYSPRIYFTLSVHLVRLLKDVWLVRSNTIIAALQSLIYDGMSEWNLSCPAVSHSCMRSTLASTLTVLETKSTPTVGWSKIDRYLLIAGEVIEDEAIDNWGLADRLVTQQDNLAFGWILHLLITENNGGLKIWT